MKYFYYSLTGHFLLAACALLTIVLTIPSSIKIIHTVPVVIYQSNANDFNINQQGNPHQITTSTHKASSGKQIGMKPSERNVTLLNLLHNAIAAVQIYPDAALALKQTGVVSVGFTLYPDGHLQGITLVKSSGSVILDQAAIAAVHGVSLENVQGYISKPTIFSIDIVYTN